MAAFSSATPRREPRRAVAVNVRVFGLNADGDPVHCECSTVDISANGVRLAGAQHWRPGEIVGIRHGSEKGRFRIVWIGEPGTHSESQIGCQAVDVSRHFWGINLSQLAPGQNTTAIGTRIGGTTDTTPKPGRLSSSNTSVSYADTRRHQRFRCNGGAKIVVSGVNHWGTIMDISAGGCYVECPSSYPVGQLLYLRIGIDDFKFETDAIVRVCYAGMGMGLEFMRTSSLERRKLEEYVAELARDPNRLRK
jgi:PilZ domain